MTTETSLIEVEIPHRTQIPVLRKWLSFGSGVGIEIGLSSLFVTLTKIRPNGIQILDALEILRYRERPAAEWGADFQSFLTKNKIRHLSATVVLPTTDAVSRSLSLPGVPDKELASAVNYQLDGLHPFAEEEAAHSYSRLAPPHSANVSIAIARHAVIEDYATIFDEAGVAVAGFVTPAAAIYSALRILQLPPAESFLAIHEDERGLLVYGETPVCPLYCVPFGQDAGRAIGAASSQIRLPDDAPIARLAALLPHTEKLQLTPPLSYAASLVSALPSQCLKVNLLPEARRKTISPWRWVPSLILLLALMGLGLALAYVQDYENHLLLTRLDAEIAKFKAPLASAKTLEKQIIDTRAKVDYLRTVAGYPRQDLDSLRELTRILPVNAYVNRLDLTRTNVVLAGEIDQAADLLKLLDSSPLFKDSEFASSPGRSAQGKEMFNIRANREFPMLSVPAATPVTPQLPKNPISPQMPPGASK